MYDPLTPASQLITSLSDSGAVLSGLNESTEFVGAISKIPWANILAMAPAVGITICCLGMLNRDLGLFDKFSKLLHQKND